MKKSKAVFLSSNLGGHHVFGINSNVNSLSVMSGVLASNFKDIAAMHIAI